MVNKVRNTEKADPMEHLALAMFGGGIEEQEAIGQSQLEHSDVLPTQCSEDDRKALEAAGVVFGEKVEGDDIFTHVTLPAGWKKQRTDHSMWTDLLDGEGTKRAAIFYKAAFYDRNASWYVPKK